jgi:hypothetical protein
MRAVKIREGEIFAMFVANWKQIKVSDSKAVKNLERVNFLHI